MQPGFFVNRYLDSMTPPIFEGRANTYSGPFNFPMEGLPGGDFGMLALPFMGPMLQQMMSRQGMLPAQFMPTQNLYDQFKSQQQFQSYQKAMQQASEIDAGTYNKMFEGFAKATGSPWGLRQQQASATMAKDIAGIAPLIAQMAPEMFDRLHGSRGSATVLAQILHRTGQHSFDPVTGRVGLSGDTAGMMSQEIFQQLYGPGANLADMKNIGAGESGMLYEQLLQRGMAAPSLGRMRGEDRIRALAGASFSDDSLERIAKRAGVSVDEVRKSQTQVRDAAAAGGPMDFQALDKLAGMDDMMRTFDAQRTGNRMKDLAGVVSAMRDIFGDMGRPDAPMREIVAGLEALTQGGLATMSPGRLESIVHETRVLAKQSGVTMDTVFGMAAQAAGQADARGLDRGFVLPSVQSSLAFGQAMGLSGRLDKPAFGTLDRDRATLLHNNLVLSAAASPAGNQISALMRLADQGVLPLTDDKGNATNAARLASAVRAGQATFEYVDPTTGKTSQRSVAMGYGEFTQMMQQSGMGMHDIGMAMQAQHANQEYGIRYNVGDIVREAQSDYDGRQMIVASFQGTLRQGAAGMGGTATEQNATATRAANDVARMLQKLDPEVYRDTDKRNDAIAQEIQDSFARQVRARSKAAGKTDAEADADAAAALGTLGGADASGIRAGARRMAVGGWGSFDQFMSKTGYTSGVGYLQMQGKTVKETAAAVRAEARTDAELVQAMSGLQATPLRRMADVIMDVKADDPLDRVISKALGAVDIKELQEKDGLVRGFVAAQQEIHTAERKDGLLTAAGAQRRERGTRAIDAAKRGGAAVDQWLQDLQREFGIDASRPQADNLRKAIEASNRSAAEKERLREMVNWVDSSRETTARDRLEALGFSSDRRITEEMIGKTQQRSARAGADLEKLGARPVGEAAIEAWRKSEAFTNAERDTGRFWDSSRDQLDQFLGSTPDVAQLGKGGLALLQGVEAKHLQLRQLAEKAGVDVQKLLLGDVDPAHRGLVGQARKLQGEITKDWDQVQTRSMGPKPTGAAAMSAGERELLEGEQKFRLMPGKAEDVKKQQAEQLTDNLIKMIGADRRGAAKASREEIYDAIMENDRQMPVFRAWQARSGVLGLAKKYKLLDEKDADSLEAQQKAIQQLGGAAMSPEDREHYERLQKTMAPIKTIGSAEADDVSEISQLLRKQVSGAKATAGAAHGDRQVVATGTLTLKGLDKVVLQGKLAGGGSVDSVPVAAEGPMFG